MEGVCLMSPQSVWSTQWLPQWGELAPASGVWGSRQEPGNRNPNKPNVLRTHFSRGGLPRALASECDDGAHRGWGEHMLLQSTKLQSVACLERLGIM